MEKGITELEMINEEKEIKIDNMSKYIENLEKKIRDIQNNNEKKNNNLPNNKKNEEKYILMQEKNKFLQNQLENSEKEIKDLKMKYSYEINSLNENLNYLTELNEEFKHKLQNQHNFEMKDINILTNLNKKLEEDIKEVENQRDEQIIQNKELLQRFKNKSKEVL